MTATLAADQEGRARRRTIGRETADGHDEGPSGNARASGTVPSANLTIEGLALSPQGFPPICPTRTRCVMGPCLTGKC